MTGPRRCRPVTTPSFTPRSARLSSSRTRCASRAVSFPMASCVRAGLASATTPIPTSCGPCTRPARHRGLASPATPRPTGCRNPISNRSRRQVRRSASTSGCSTSGLPMRDSRQVVLGNYNPDWSGGITNTLTYKNLSLSFSFDGQLGGKVYSVTKWFGQYSGILQATLQGRENQWNDRFVVPNAVYESCKPDTTHVLAQDYWHNTFYANEMGIVDASYLKLRELRLAYNMPSSVARLIGFSQATIALVGRNLLLWAKQPTIDT